MRADIIPVDFAPWIPAIIVVFFGALYIHKNKKNVRSIPAFAINERLESFEPEPLIDITEIKKINEADLDRLQPNEADPNCLNLAKVNFLNVLDKEDIKAEAEKCIRSNGVGSCGPRGFYGTIDIHLNLESRIAEFMGMEETVLYSYGFSTIASAIGAYCKKSDILFCDEKISFCAKQGMVAAKSKVVYFKHNDMEDLESKLKEYETIEKAKKKLFRKFLLVEGIYGLTGTICPLPELMKLRKEYKLRIFIDESLSFGVLGEHGRGVTEHFNIDRSDVDMIMGSLEGSIGSIGGFCVGASVVIEHQRLSGLGYCFSASLPPFLSHISIYVLDMFEKNPEVFQKLQDVSSAIDKQLKSLKDYEVLSSPISPVKVLTVKDKTDASGAIDKIRKYCAQQNMYVTQWDDNLYLNANISMGEKEINKIVSILGEASKLV